MSINKYNYKSNKKKVIKYSINLSKFLLIFVILAFSSCSDDPKPDPKPDPSPNPVPTTINSVITFDQPKQQIDIFFYDIKQSSKAITTASKANDIFVLDDLNGMRIPVLGNLMAPAHPSAGVVVASIYESYVNSINFAKQARAGKDFKIFASKKLNDDDGSYSFPAWAKDTNGIIPDKYAILLADFIKYMNSKNIQIDYLAIDNEYVYNEGNITPEKYSKTIDALRILATNRDFKMPILVGYEDFGPGKRNWVKKIMDNGWGDKMDIYGTHYYTEWRPKDKLLADLALIENRPFWATEAHWNTKSGVDDLEEAEAAIVTLWDQIDVGMSGFMWWNYQLTGLRGNLMRNFSTPLLGAQPINITDIDGEDISTLGKLQTRAFKEGNTITVFAVNITNTNHKKYAFRLDGSSINSKVNIKQWTETSSDKGRVLVVSPVGDKDNIFSLTLPKKSITRFIFNIQ